MNLDDMKKVWHDMSDSTRGTMEAFVMQVLKAERFERQILRRDYIETAAALLVAVGFLPALFLDFGWISRLGVLIIMLGAAEAVIVLHWVRRKGAETPLDVPLAQYCRAERVRVERQITMLRWVAWWYIAPLIGGACLFVVGLLGRPESPVVALLECLLLLMFGVLGAGVHWMNQRAVDHQLIPLRDSLQQTEQDLANDVSGGS